MSEARELLDTLRDIGEPPPPSGSPPLLIVANVALAVSIVLILLHRARRRRRAWLDESLAAIDSARDLAPDAALLALAKTLRRVMHHRRGTAVAALHGEAWLAALDEEFGDDWFTDGAGRVFGDTLYAPLGDAIDAAAIDRLGRTLAHRLKRLPRSPAVPRARIDAHGASASDTMSARRARGR